LVWNTASRSTKREDIITRVVDILWDHGPFALLSTPMLRSAVYMLFVLKSLLVSTTYQQSVIFCRRVTCKCCSTSKNQSYWEQHNRCPNRLHRWISSSATNI